MSRTKKGQAEHDREVRRFANEYKRKGYEVEADLPNWEQPDTIKGVEGMWGQIFILGNW